METVRGLERAGMDSSLDAVNRGVVRARTFSG